MVLSFLRTNLKPCLCVQRKRNSSSSLRRRSSTFLDQGLPALVEARKEEAVEDVKWVVIATGRGGGDIWPGFVAAIDICGMNGDVCRGTLTVIRESTKRIDVPAGVIASGGTVCSCQWEGGQPHLQLVQAVFFETSQDMYVMRHVRAVPSTSSTNRNAVSFLDKAKHRLGIAKWIWHIQVSQLNSFDARCDTITL